MVYDAAAVSRILGLPAECSEPVPQEAGPGIILYYGGWDLRTLRLSPAGLRRMSQEVCWYDEYPCSAEAGYYKLLLPVPNSGGKHLRNQLRVLASIGADWQPVPVTVAMTALLVHVTKTGADLLFNRFCRCAEVWQRNEHVEVAFDKDRACVWRGQAIAKDLFLGAARKISTLTS